MLQHFVKLQLGFEAEVVFQGGASHDAFLMEGSAKVDNLGIVGGRRQEHRHGSLRYLLRQQIYDVRVSGVQLK